MLRSRVSWLMGSRHDIEVIGLSVPCLSVLRSFLFRIRKITPQQAGEAFAEFTAMTPPEAKIKLTPRRHVGTFHVRFLSRGSQVFLCCSFTTFIGRESPSITLKGLSWERWLQQRISGLQPLNPKPLNPKP